MYLLLSKAKIIFYKKEQNKLQIKKMNLKLILFDYSKT